MSTFRIGIAATALALVVAGCGGSGNSSGTAFNRVWGGAVAGSQNGNATTATFSNPANVVVASDQTVYVADYDSGLVRAISSSGQVTTLVSQANFSLPFGLAMSKAGDLYVETDADPTGAHDATTGSLWKVDRITGLATLIVQHLGRPRGLGVLSTGKIVCSDLGNSTIYTVDPSNGAATPVAGLPNTAGFKDGTGTGALFSRPYGLAVMSDDSILVADQTNNRIRHVTLAGVATTYAGTGTQGSQNNPAASATFNMPQAVAVAPDGTVYVSDHDNHVIRKIKSGQVTTEAGDGTAGFKDATGLQAEFFGLEGIGVNADGSILWMADGNNGNGDPYNRVRRLRVP